MALRRCTKTGCQAQAVATLTYVYADQTAVLGPLAPEHVPGGYDLCAEHCERLSPPRGWEVIRRLDAVAAPAASVPGAAPDGPDEGDDLLALADAVREVGLRPDEVAPRPASGTGDGEVVVLAERRHLRVVGDPAGDA